VADITLCLGTGCPIRSTCKRFLTTPNVIWQSYFTEPPFIKTKSKYKSVICEYYWKVETKKE
jgi:hypothetical protein